MHDRWGGYRGVAHYSNWKTGAGSFGISDNWLCMIGQNGGSFPNNILADGSTRGTATGGTGDDSLRINVGPYGTSERSDWALSCVMII